jgi:hypothetical protein
MRGVVAALAAALALLAAPAAARDPNECEVCAAVLGRVADQAKGMKDLVAIETVVGNVCAKPGNDKENKLVRGVPPAARRGGAAPRGGTPAHPVGPARRAGYPRGRRRGGTRRARGHMASCRSHARMR